MSLKNKINITIVCIILIISKSIVGLELESDINKKKTISFFQNLKDFSCFFIQSDNLTVEEGKIYLKKNKKRIRVEYTSPSKIIIVLSNNKAMYFNEDLEEVSYFNPKDSIANIFYDVFYDENYFEQTKFINKKNTFIIEKDINIQDQITRVSIIFEKKPYAIKQILIKNDEINLTITITNTNFNSDLDDNLFSLAHPLIN